MKRLLLLLSFGCIVLHAHGQEGAKVTTDKGRPACGCDSETEHPPIVQPPHPVCGLLLVVLPAMMLIIYKKKAENVPDVE